MQGSNSNLNHQPSGLLQVGEKGGHALHVAQ
jgi:hypothetical protein